MRKHFDFFRCREFQPLDHYFAKQMLKLSFREKDVPENAAEAIYLASGLVCFEAARGNVCMNVLDFAGTKMQATEKTGAEISVKFPEISAWLQMLETTAVVGTPNTDKPLILEMAGNDAYLYLNRYWQYEYRLACNLHKLMQPVEVDESLLQEGLARLFPADAIDAESLQRNAAEIAVKNKFCVISGGPGTGKTTVVMKILSLLFEQAGEETFHVKLAAPTGKAAARLKNAIATQKQKWFDNGLITRKIHDQIQEEASTLHRLLGVKRNSVYFRHNRKNPLVLDCLIIDEASMVDLAMMSKLVEALPENARLILLGDMDQLSSVEAGSVFGDICAGYQSPVSPLGKSIVKLKWSYRFDEQRGIGKLSNLVNSGMAEEAWEYIQSFEDRQVAWGDLPSGASLRHKLKEHVLPHYRQYLAATDITEAFARLNAFSILCGLRNGFYGANAINALIEKMLLENDVASGDEAWYQGKPIMVTRNDYQRQLFNGDVGIFFVDPADHQKKVFFETAEPGQYRKISPGLLPEHESVFAMTVHKSQGSEYGRTLLILPDTESDILTRELIYTGITRARHKVEIWSSRAIFLQAVGRKCKRNSGLTEKLLTFCREI